MKKAPVSAVLRLCFSTMLLNGLYATMGGLLMPLLRAEHGYSYDMGGLLLSTLNVGNLVASFACGVVALGIGQKRSIVLFTLFSTLAYAMMSRASHFFLLVIAFGLIGLSKGAVYNLDNILVAQHSIQKRRDSNLLHACYAVGSLLCAPVASALLQAPWGWRTIAFFLMLCCGALPIVYGCFPLPSFQKRAHDRREGLSFLRKGRFWIISFFLLFEIGTETAVSGWVITYFQDCGLLPQAMAQMMLTVNWGLMAAGRFAVALLPLRIAPAKLLISMSVGTLVFVGVLLLGQTSGMAIVGLVGFSLCVTGIQPTLLACADPDICTPKALSFLLPIGASGGIWMPAAVGLAAMGMGIRGGMSVVAASAFFMLLCSLLFGKRYARVKEKG